MTVEHCLHKTFVQYVRCPTKHLFKYPHILDDWDLVALRLLAVEFWLWWRRWLRSTQFVALSGPQALAKHPTYVRRCEKQIVIFVPKFCFQNLFLEKYQQHPVHRRHLQSIYTYIYIYGRKSADRTEHGNYVILIVFLAIVFGNLEVWNIRKWKIFLKYISAAV